MFIDIHIELGNSRNQNATVYWEKNRRIPEKVAESFLGVMKPVEEGIVIEAPGNLLAEDLVWSPLFCQDVLFNKSQEKFTDSL